MTMQNVDSNILSNLVVHEVNPSAGYARRNIVIDDGGFGQNDPSTYTVAIPMGKLVYRLNSASALDLNASYTAFDVTDEYGDGDGGNPAPGPDGEVSGVVGLTSAYNFAVVFGDKYAASDNWNTSGEGLNDAVAFVRGEVQLKADVIWKANNITNSGDKKAVKALLERQGIILLESNGVVIN